MKAYLEIEMPRCCNKCPLFVYEGIGICVCRVLPAIEDGEILKPWKNRRKECPLKAVQEHGRLIDADALNYTMLYKENWMSGTGVEAPAVWKKDIDASPTIIPASEEGET